MSWKTASTFIAGQDASLDRDLAGAALLSALGCCWNAIRQCAAHELPEVVLVAAPMGGALGSFTPLRWFPRKGNGALLHEVMVSVDSLALGPEETLATLLHEAAHSLNWLHNVADCSRSQYHNSYFAERAATLGLTVTRIPHYGLAQTSLAPGTAGKYADLLALLDAVLVHRADGVDTPKVTEARYLRGVCACPFVIRLSRRTLCSTVIRCERCGQAFRVG